MLRVYPTKQDTFVEQPMVQKLEMVSQIVRYSACVWMLQPNKFMQYIYLPQITIPTPAYICTHPRHGLGTLSI